MSRLLLLLILAVSQLSAYSVLSHEALVDALWDIRIKPILLTRYANATAEDLNLAHSYAYGGAIIQDIGYYPRGSEPFSDLAHYVRGGDFVSTLIRDAKNINELAFALGALSHYIGDVDGHSLGTNLGEPILYPRLRKKFGSVITYEDRPSYHLKTEFGFDVLEVARGNFAPQAYHDFIGFNVAPDLVTRAFQENYGIPLSEVFSDFATSIDFCRSAVSRTIPTATRVAWAQRHDEIKQAEPNMSHRRFVYIMRRSSYEKEWGRRRDEPNIWDKILAFLLRLIPPIGPLQALKLKIPTPEVEMLFTNSFDEATEHYREKLDAVNSKTLVLEDLNYDVGKTTKAGEYFMSDDVHALWLHKLAEKHFATLTPAMKTELTGYFGDLSADMKLKQNADQWKQLQTDYAELKAAR